MKGLHIHIEGAVQGVGFRPFIYRLATESGLKGKVWNDGQGVDIEVEGPAENLEEFLVRIPKEKPPRAVIHAIEYQWIPPNGYKDFQIIESQSSAELNVWILPDIATCDECLREVFDPSDRRYLYPFTNCTNCGPRYSIIHTLPYDRRNTTMHSFTMCPACQAEYEDPLNRRYHAQPNACPVCGPKVFLTDRQGKILSDGSESMQATVELLTKGYIVALKGIGGFQLLADATNDQVVRRLRERKHRPAKPFALMVPDIFMAEIIAELNSQEKFWLTSPEAPIVIVKKRQRSEINISESVAPDNPTLGIMLPCSPLHHIIMKLLQQPVIATSGNVSEEPICYRNEEALERLGKIADYFLLNDRPIVHPVDDSVMKIVNGKPLMIRRARGFAPLPFQMDSDMEDVLAVGGHLKDTVSIARRNMIFVSQHIGDLDNAETLQHFDAIQKHLLEIYQVRPVAVLHDLHPDYNSTGYVQETYSNLSKIPVQHHQAHFFSVLAEHNIPLPALGIIWDGTGYGEDGTVWGGEGFILDETGIRRVATFLPFGLPGGEIAIREPWRVALSLLHEAKLNFIPASWNGKLSSDMVRMTKQLLEKNIRCIPTSSAGRIFDGVSALCGLKLWNTFEGEAAIRLEYEAMKYPENLSGYPFHFIRKRENDWIEVDWRPMMKQVVDDIIQKKEVPEIAARFHQTMVDIIIELIRAFSISNIVISGGCFQNSILIGSLEKQLEETHFQLYRPQMIPPNDGCISIGQIIRYQWLQRWEQKKGELHVSGRTGQNY
jgi:hydrogenase maturation protein HypF